MDAKLYGHGDRQSKTKMILECIDRSYGHKEVVDYKDPNLNIEHVMPQTLSEAWRTHLGDNCEVVHELLLHTLGNLTLTGYNSELSNSDFSRKKEFLQHSHLQINDYFDSATSWREEDIERRAAVLADTAIGIWPYFGDAQPESQSDVDIKKKPGTLAFLGRTHNVESWRDVLEETVNVVADVYPERLEEIIQSMPRLLSPNAAEFISSRQLKNGMFLNVNLSAKEINRYCRRVLDLAGIDSSDWAVGMD